MAKILRPLLRWSIVEYSFDGRTIGVGRPWGRKVCVEIQDIEEIGVETTDKGPFMEDVFWVINRDKECLRIPEPAAAFPTLMKCFESWDGFDWKPFVEAMSCTENRYFRCWKRGRESE